MIEQQARVKNLNSEVKIRKMKNEKKRKENCRILKLKQLQKVNKKCANKQEPLSIVSPCEEGFNDGALMRV